jgi:ribonuclease T2
MLLEPKVLARVGIVAVVVVGALALWRLLTPGGEEPPPPTASDVSRPTGGEAPPAAAAQAPAVQAVPPPREATTLPAPKGDFDYYVLTLSWSPTHCASEAGEDEEDDMQCRSGRPYGFVLHGLWPQDQRGYPQMCHTDEPRKVSSENMARMLEVAPSKQLVQHEWRKHGTCAGLTQDDYFSAAIKAFASVAVPAAYKLPAAPIETTADEVRDAFLSANPTLKAENLSATCRRNRLAELWVCLDKSLKPRACSPEVRKRHCGERHVRMLAVRGDWP